MYRYRLWGKGVYDQKPELLTTDTQYCENEHEL